MSDEPFISIFDYGFYIDGLVLGDYTGDRKTEPTVWRPSKQSYFYVAQFPMGTNGITLDRADQWRTKTNYPQVQDDFYDPNSL